MISSGVLPDGKRKTTVSELSFHSKLWLLSAVTKLIQNIRVFIPSFVVLTLSTQSLVCALPPTQTNQSHVSWLSRCIQGAFRVPTCNVGTLRLAGKNKHVLARAHLAVYHNKTQCIDASIFFVVFNFIFN